MVTASRRTILAGVAGLGATSSPWLGHSSAHGQAPAPWPSRPVAVVVGFSAGSSTDVAARILAERLGESLGQRFVVENKPGAASRIAADSVARSAKDGHTLFVGTVANVINESLNPGSSTFVRDLEPVALFGTVPNILVVPAATAVSDVAGLVALGRAKPGELSYGSPGQGTSPHLSGELFAQLAGLQLVHVPYSGSAQAVTDLLAGRIGMMFAPASSVMQHVRAGTLRALASSEQARTTVAPDLPTVAESGLAGFDTSVWFGLMAPAGTSADIVDRLARAVAGAVGSDALRSLFVAQGIDPIAGGPDAFRDRIATEARKWNGVAERAGLVRRSPT